MSIVYWNIGSAGTFERNFFHGGFKREYLFSMLIVFALIFFCAKSQANPISKDNNLRIMPLGDSITEGKFVGTGGYRQYLQNLLRAGGYAFTFVGKEDSGQPGTHTGFSDGMSGQPNHEGYGSYRIDQIETGVASNSNPPEGFSALPIETTITNNKPDVILMMLGTNDCVQIFYSPDGIGYNGQTGWAAQAAQRLYSLVGKIFATKPNVMLVLAQFTPIYVKDNKNNGQSDPWWYNTWTVQPYNALIAQIVTDFQAQGRNIVLVDQWHNIVVANDMGSDGTHPASCGYQKMASVWYEGLTRGYAIVSGGYYKLVNPESGKALDVYGAQKDNGSTVDIWDQNCSGAQVWQINRESDGTYTLVNPNSNQALEESANCRTSPCPVDIYSQNGTNAQKWSLNSNTDGTFTVVNPNGDLALSVTGLGTANGSIVHLYTQNGTGAEKWQIVPVQYPVQ